MTIPSLHSLIEGEADTPGGSDRARLAARVLHDLTVHPPETPYISEAMDAVRSAAQDFAAAVLDRGCVPSREVSCALTAIEEACFWAIASIARHQGENR